MCEIDALCRVHGGVGPPRRGNLGYRSRSMLNLGAGLAIARASAPLVHNNQSLAVSIGTTPEVAMRELTGVSDISLLTNNLHTTTTVCDREGVQSRHLVDRIHDDTVWF